MLVKALDFLIQKQISNKDTILTSSKYFAGFLWLYSIDIKNMKSAKIRNNYIKGIHIGSIYTRSSSIKDSCIKVVYYTKILWYR